jgi:hypothetical protein
MTATEASNVGGAGAVVTGVVLAGTSGVPRLLVAASSDDAPLPDEHATAPNTTTIANRRTL